MIDDIVYKLKNMKDEIIEDSINLINFKSITGDIDENIKALDFIKHMAEESGIKSFYTQKKDCLVLEIGQGGETLGILTHVDVVDIGDIKKWITSPFEGQFDGEYIIGRGAMDDKGPTIIIYKIMELLNSLKLNYKRKIQFIIGTSEEDVWTDMESFKREFELPDFGFTPDGEFPIHNIENGYADTKIKFKLSSSTENKNIILLESGKSPNTIPSISTLIYEFESNDELDLFLDKVKNSELKLEYEDLKLTLSAIGKSSHSSLPENGDNALIKLVDFIYENIELKSDIKNILKFILLMKNDYYGNGLGFNNENEFFKGEFIGKTVANPTVLKFENNEILLNINIRNRYGINIAEINDIFDRLSNQFQFEYKIDNYLSPLYVSKNKPEFQLMNEAYKKVTGIEGGFSLARGTSYAKALENFVSWGPVFPGEIDTCHQENEKINAESVMRCAEIYLRYIYDEVIQ